MPVPLGNTRDWITSANQGEVAYVITYNTTVVIFDFCFFCSVKKMGGDTTPPLHPYGV